MFPALAQWPGVLPLAVSPDLAADLEFGLPGRPVGTDHSRLTPEHGIPGVIEPSDRHGEMEQ